jgi:hypothetical protein
MIITGTEMQDLHAFVDQGGPIAAKPQPKKELQKRVPHGAMAGVI